jgi:hypothetical protein
MIEKHRMVKCLVLCAQLGGLGDLQAWPGEARIKG